MENRWKMGNKVVLLGVFPPPVHGAALVNAAVRDALLMTGNVGVTVLDLAQASLRRAIHSRLLRIPKIAQGVSRFLLLCLREKPDVLYLAASGGLGQIYESIFVALARAFDLAVVIHHHSFSYVDADKWHFRWLAWCAGQRALHVTLCARMSQGLHQRYAIVTQSICVSNVAWVSGPSHVQLKEKIETIGFFGNISREKGIFSFLEIARSLSGEPIKFEVGGNFLDNESEKRFFSELKDLPTVRYLGAKFGAEKEDFFRNLDLLIFPSTYIHEAEPLTIIEAIQYGVPVIAANRGCIESLVSISVGKLVGAREDFVGSAIQKIREWQLRPEVFRGLSVSVSKYMEGARLESLKARTELIAYLCNPKR